MYNLKSSGGTFKGLAGECMFQISRDNCFMTRFYPLEFILRKYDDRLTCEQKEFLRKNWLSIDAIEFQEDNICLYEIKTRNSEYVNKYRLVITKNTLNILKNAEEIGFKVKLAKVLLHNNWNYEVKIEDFQYDRNKMWINTNNNYDKADSNYKNRVKSIN